MMRFWWIAAMFLACGGDGGDTSATADGCDACGADQFCLVLATGDDFDAWEEQCEPLPATCTESPSCDCAGDLYDGCPDETSAFACSDGSDLVFVTCTL